MAELEVARHGKKAIQIVSPKGKRLLTRMVASPQLYERYGNYIALAKDIIKDIDQAYPDAH